MVPSIIGFRRKISLNEKPMKKFILFAALLCVTCPMLSRNPVKGITKESKVWKPLYSAQKQTEESLLFYAGKGYAQNNAEVSFGFWDAFSDRENNTTYVTNSDSKPYSSLGFRERVRIARIKKDYALVYTPKEESSFSYPIIPDDVEWRGWVPMSNLVYYDWTLIGPEGVCKRVLLNDDVVFSSAHLMLEEKLYEQPAEDGSTLELPNSSNSFFYEIKRDKGFILLATGPEIIRPECIYGWVREKDAMIWDSRMAIEPTWDISDYEYFREKGSKCDVYNLNDKKIGALTFNSMLKGGGLRVDRLRMQNGIWRFPVLREIGSIGYECAMSGQSEYLFEPSQKVAVTQVGDRDDNSDTPWINVFFVIDGSRLYEPFFPLLADRIQALSVQDHETGIRIGATIYHDSRNDSFMMESYPLSSPDDPGLYEFLDQGGQYGFKDNLSEAPLIAALNECLDRVGFGEDAKNYIVVIGGRGDNSDSEISPEELGARFAAQGINVYGLQVQNNPTISAYRIFNYMMEDLIRTNVSRTVEDMVLTDRSSLSDETGIITTFLPRYFDTKIFQTFISPGSGLMSEMAFSENLERILQRIGESASAWGALSSMYPEFFRHVKVKRSADQHGFFKEVALFSETELDDLLQVFSLLHEQGSRKNPDRASIVNYLIRSYLSVQQTKEKKIVLSGYGQVELEPVRKMGYFKVISAIAGLRPSESYYPGHTLRELESDKSVSDDELKFILSDLSRHYYRLLEVRQTPTVYRTMINGEAYYWVPVEDIL